MNKNEYRKGVISILTCGFLWGVLPVYWNALKPIDSFVIIFYRVVLMALVCLAVCAHKYGFKGLFKPMFETKKNFITFFTAGIIITLNWSIYIWAVNAGFVIQSSMGYFLEPLLVCIFGVIIYKEKMNGFKKISMIFALCGLLVMIAGYRQIPLIAVGLGMTFAVYSAIKKSVNVDPMQSLLYETIFLVPVALGFIIYYETTGMGALAAGGTGKFILLLFAGIATAVPLGLFGYSASRLPLITLGISEYISPSISLILGIFLFREPFDIIQFSAFVLIWIGLVFFTFGEVKDQKELKN